VTLQPLVDLARQRGGLGPDDLVACLAPLFRQVIAAHERGLVAPLRGIDALVADERYRVRFDEAAARPPLPAEAAVAAVERTVRRDARAAVEIVGRSDHTLDTGTGAASARSLDVVHPPVDAAAVRRPVLVSGWQTWEHVVGHHDELTDIASLGELLAALACGLDLADPADADLLAAHRDHLLAIAPGTHPVIAQLAAQMIEPDRHSRAPDLPSLLQRLESYRDQPLDFDLDSVPGAGSGDRDGRRAAVLGVLRDRLFDLTRRNRLVYFRPTQRSLDLTEASVPLLLDVRNIRPEHLFTWSTHGDDGARRVLRRAVALGSVLRWDDAPYAAGVLDAMISQARRDLAEYGSSQLRLVVAFLRWHDLKGVAEERISSPLLLLPVELTRRRGVRDGYLLRATATVAEVNPALRQYLDQLYGLRLPETLDLAEDDAVTRLHADLAAQIRASEPAVQLDLREKPRIELVRQRAQLRLAAYQRRSGRLRASVAGRSYAYSYSRRDFRPLGVQIFSDRVAPRPAPVGVALGEQPAPRTPAMVAGSLAASADGAPVVEREAYVLDRGEAGNPYRWEVDLCAVTLANLNYRTMSLVRDYRDLLGTGRRCVAFDQVFSIEPRPLVAEVPELPLADRHLVVPADGSQVAAIARAREGGSFVIQGPPGTGKSQTITNLIADYVARGRRVLFVCQKRAAIDVVHARLRQQGLDELTCLIHDSQADKKAFVRGLKATYEAWLEGDGDLAGAVARRDAAVRRLEAAVAELAAYEAALDTAPASTLGAAGSAGTASPDGAAGGAGDAADADGGGEEAPTGAGGPGTGPPPRELVRRLVALHADRWGEALTPDLRRLLPTAAAWWAARPVVEALAAALADVREARLAGTPWAHLAPVVLSAARPEAEVAHRAGIALGAVDRLVAAFTLPGGPDAATLTLPEARAVSELAAALAPLAERGRASALHPSSPAAESLRRDVAAWAELRAAADATSAAAVGWHDPLTPDDTTAALAVARARETSVLRWLSGDWRRVRAVVRRRFDPGDRAVPLSVTASLELLAARQAAEAALATASRAHEASWGWPDPAELAARLQGARSGCPEAWRELLASLDDPAPAEALDRAAEEIAQLGATLHGLLTGVEAVPLRQLRELLGRLADPSSGATLRRLAPVLTALPAHPQVAAALRALPGTPAQVEYAVAAAALEDAATLHPTLERFDGRRLADLVAGVQELLPLAQAAESALIVEQRRTAFLEETRHAAQSATGMDAAGRERKKMWSAGRRALEHEFGKVMRYRSIRDLSSGEPGAVVSVLRPIWLMSPTSVSDTLPLDPGLFDVVIYDEASQIPVEEAVPAMHRAEQVVVVGDRMQLPPTQYFTTRATGDPADGDVPAGAAARAPVPAAVDAADDDDDDGDDEIGVVLDGDSFLAQSAVRLPGTMLTWHYRSRYEALIAFSNAAFYGGRLATVPDRSPLSADRPDVAVDVPADGTAEAVPAEAVVAGVDALLERSISVHRTHGAVYRRRANPGEAAYVAALVREFLRRETGLTIGVVAFSEAQQGEIERALERLAATDDDFARRYEAELAREDGEQAVGLFVKNLENVQGDERDVIVMSVCYAPGANGRMLMNFGPINQRGGEKRLNVIMSRARRHMAVVSTIEPAAITNVYNDGAATLRRFLTYATAVSRGDAAAAATALASAGEPLGGTRPAETMADAATSQLAATLRERGLDVAERVGQSAFRCDLAVRRPGDAAYRVAVLVDTPDRITGQPVAERVLSHPMVLRAAGWRVVHVLTKDWLTEPADVVASVESALS
jgi:hypothetical protein